MTAAFIHGGFTIANGVVIEKAVGGSGNDSITGNSADNTFKGRGGDDTIEGGAGTDTADHGRAPVKLHGNGRGQCAASRGGVQMEPTL